MTASPSVAQRLQRRYPRLYRGWEILIQEGSRFGVVGLVAFIVDLSAYNVLVFGVPGGDSPGPLGDGPLMAKTITVAIGTVVAWTGNRFWTFRHRRRERVWREFGLYVMFNAVGLLITLAVLGTSRYILGFDSQLADNISGNGIGLVLATMFRFWSYRTFVFRNR